MEPRNHIAGTVAVCFMNLIIVVFSSLEGAQLFCSSRAPNGARERNSLASLSWNQKRLMFGTARKTGVALFT
jgi:hypothetical protein